MRKKLTGERIFDLVNGLIMIMVIIIMVYPFLNVLAISLNDGWDSAAGGIGIFPRKFSISSYESIFKYNDIYSAFWVSVARTVIGTALSLGLTSMAAFAMTKKELPGYKFIYYFFIVAMFLPGGLIPSFMLYRNLGLYNSFWVYIFPGIFLTHNFILFRTFIIQQPKELQDAAYIDGASELQVFWKVVIPLSKPIMATLGLFVAVREWNSWQDTLYYVTNSKLQTLQYVLMTVLKEAEASAIAEATSRQMSQLGGSVTTNSIKMAITIVAILPIICVYPFLQKYFEKGTMIGAVKG